MLLAQVVELVNVFTRVPLDVFPTFSLIAVHNSMFSLAGDAVVNVYINHEKKFAFVEMRTVEEASNAMTLDGIIFEANQSSFFPFFLSHSVSKIKMTSDLILNGK